MDLKSYNNLLLVIVLINYLSTVSIPITTDEDPSLGIESFAIINLAGVFTKLNWDLLIYFMLNLFSKCCKWRFPGSKL